MRVVAWDSVADMLWLSRCWNNVFAGGIREEDDVDAVAVRCTWCSDRRTRDEDAGDHSSEDG